MGDILGSAYQSVFGGERSKSKSTWEQSSESGNRAYPYIQDTFSGVASNTGRANDYVSRLLGLGGDASVQKAAFDQYREGAGYNFLRDEGMSAVTGSQAAKGLLKSGSTLTRLQDRGTQLADTFLNNYLDRLNGLSTQGIQAGALISDAGKYSTSTGSGVSNSSGSEKPGITKFLGMI